MDMFKYYEEEIYRGLRLFGWANNNVMMLKEGLRDKSINEAEYNELMEIHKRVSKEPEYQFF